MVGLAVNMALTLYVYEELRERHDLSMLVDTNMLNLPASDDAQYSMNTVQERLHTIYAMPQRSTEQKAAKDEALMTLVLELADNGFIRNHRDLVTNEAWERYQVARENHAAQQAQYEDDYELWKEEGGHGTPPRYPDTEKPADPRIEVSNKITQKWITVYSPGAKPQSSLESKVRRKIYKDGEKFKGMQHITDMSRLMISPYIPRVADDFFHITEHQLPPKEYNDGKQYPRTYLRPWDVTEYGYMSRKAYIAMDRLAESGTKERSEGLHGMIGEIKVVGAHMHEAEKLTDPVYAVLRELDNTNRFMPTSGGDIKSKEHLAQRKKLRRVYDKSADIFAQRCKELNIDPGKYMFPPYVKQENRPSSYDALRQSLTNLQLDINMDALNHAGYEWQQQFLYSAYYQMAGKEGTRTLALKTGHKETDDKHYTLPTPKLRKVAPDLNHNTIRAEAEQQWAVDHKREHRRA